RSAVSRSCAFIEKPPSPSAARTGASGRASFAPMAALNPYDMPDSPFDIQNVSGCLLGQNCPNTYLWEPTSVVTIVSAGSARASAFTMSPGDMVDPFPADVAGR